MKQIDVNAVNGFVMGDINSTLGSHRAGITGSYLQTERHALVSDRFQVIQAASVGNALAERGFNLTSVLTGRSRHTDKVDYQRTIARYRSKDIFDIQDLHLDIIYISKHMGRGCDELRLGFYRGVCANQWASGTLFEMIRFRHTGNALEDIQNGIAAVLTQRTKLVETIQKMQATQLNGTQIAELAEKYASIRLQDKSNVVRADFRRLARIRREEDKAIDLFTVANVLQENVIRYPFAYDLQGKDEHGNDTVRHMHTRVLKESSAQLVDLNGQLLDAAMQYAA